MQFQSGTSVLQTAQFVRLRPRILRAVNEESRRSEFANSAGKQVVLGQMTGFENVEPGLAMNHHEVFPIILAMLTRHCRRDGRSKLPRIRCSGLEKSAGRWFASVVVDRFKNDRGKTFGFRESHSHGSYCAVTVSPENASIDVL